MSECDRAELSVVGPIDDEIDGSSDLRDLRLISREGQAP